MATRCKFYKECSGYAIAVVPFSKTPLCKYHFIKYLKDRVWKTIKNYNLFDLENPNEKILVALSGGKDSQTLLHILDNVINKRIKMEGLLIDVGVSPGKYSEKSLKAVEKLTNELEIPLNVLSIEKEIGFDIDDVHKLGIRMNSKEYRRNNRFRGECSYCGVIKRYFINKFAHDNNFTKVATGHNLTDEATTLFSNFLNVDLDLMSRAGAITSTDVNKLVPRIKPLYYIYESELILYSFYANIDHVATQCEYAEESPMIKLKRSLLKVEDLRRGTMNNMVYNFQNEMKEIIFKNRASYKNEENYCGKCKMPTYILSDNCSFCTTVDRLGEQLEKYKILL